MKNLKLAAVTFLGITTLISCNNDDGPVNEEEVITTVTTTLTNGSNVITLKSRDLDGDGPNPPVITVSGNLNSNTVYSGAVTFLNETVTPPDDITVEVKAEGDEHQLFFQAPSAVGTFVYTDADANGKPIGLAFTLTTKSATTGNLLVTLRHLPNKSASGVATGDITNAGGATDAAITYPIVVAP
jgi:hypothetical protein